MGASKVLHMLFGFLCNARCALGPIVSHPKATNLLHWVVLIHLGTMWSRVSAGNHRAVNHCFWFRQTRGSTLKSQLSIFRGNRPNRIPSYPKKLLFRQHHHVSVFRDNTRRGAVLNGLFVPRGGGTDSSSTRSASTTVTPVKAYHKVYIAVGSNLGNRFENIASALKLLCSDDSAVRLIRSSFLHETAPMYVTDQPSFLNGAVEVETILSPMELLQELKRIEEQLGRDFSGIRNGPRPVDLDIIMMWMQSPEQQLEEAAGETALVPVVMDTPKLTIPHQRMSEREFVLLPLCDMGCNNLVHPILNDTIGNLYQTLMDDEQQQLEDNDTAISCPPPAAVQSLPLPRDRMLYFDETVIMGVLNVTPDSFSDGGKLQGSVEIAVQEALQMVKDGAGIIDIGGESTRPGAKEVAIEEEIERTIPVIEGIRRQSCDIPISIDTRHASVARAAIEAGADIVNDVSGGTFDPNMLATVAELGVPIVLMHMRGTPETMQSMTGYDDIVLQVAESLLQRSRNAEKAGIPRWLQVLDPGIGFAKDLKGNLLLLKHLSGRLKSELGESFPLLLGTSRKGFIGKITGETVAAERDYGSVASCISAICVGDNNGHGCNILRVHNVKGTKQAVMVMDAIRKV